MRIGYANYDLGFDRVGCVQTSFWSLRLASSAMIRLKLRRLAFNLRYL